MSTPEPITVFDAHDREGQRHAARFWFQREQVEVEAASLFAALADRIDASGPANLAALSREGASDELRHADRCRALVDALHPRNDLPQVPRTRRAAPLGPSERTLSPGEHALYAAVALGCVTETLSVALLMEIQKRATHSDVKTTAHEILRDEIRHSRLGWAYLEYVAARADVTWLSAHVPAMIRAALREEIPQATESAESAASSLAEGSLEAFGVLGRTAARRTCETAIAQVIVPGLARVGIVVA